MLQKDDYVRYAGEGGLYLWDNECQVRWHNLDASNRTDWLLFFDVCCEDPTQYTEAIIAAIMNGLCPQKIVACTELTKTGYDGEEGVDWGRRKFWYLREGKKKTFGIDSVPEFTELRRMAGERMCLFETEGAGAQDRLRSVRERVEEIERQMSAEFPLDQGQVKVLLGELRQKIQTVREAEAGAIEALNSALR